MQDTLTAAYELPKILLSYKSKVKPSLLPSISCSKDAYAVLIKSWEPTQIDLKEEFKILLLNRSNKVIGQYKVSSGGSTSTIVDPKLVLAAAINSNACGIILAHNHPSGSLKPSQADIKLTKKISDGARLFDIAVLDHVIVTSEGYFSFADEGLLD